jgi:hypothetical protein
MQIGVWVKQFVDQRREYCVAEYKNSSFKLFANWQFIRNQILGRGDTIAIPQSGNRR